MNARFGQQILLLVEAQSRSELALSELERTLGCCFVGLDDVDALARQRFTSPVALLEISPANHLELAKQLQSDFMVKPYDHLILFQRQPGPINIDPFWQCGLALYVPVFDGMEALYLALDRFFTQQRELVTLRYQVQEASDIAMLSMSVGSQLGEIIKFLEKSYECADYQQLGELLNEALERLGVDGCGLIEVEDGELLYFGLEDRRDAWQRLILEMRNKGRFVDLDNRTIANFDNISVMARNMPDVGSEPYGRMKDMLFTLVEGAEARVKTLALERAVSLSENAKSTFLRVMSHELRTPMNAITGFSGRLQAKQVGSEFSEREQSAITMIQDNAARLMDMIEDLEDLSSVNVDSLSAKRKVLVEEVLSGLMRVTQHQAESGGVGFVSSFSEPGVQAELDPRRLLQVMKKLCANALKYTSQGEIRVMVETRDDPEQGELLELSVQDSGLGIPPEKLRDLFRPVSQLYDDYVNHHQGTGLGVAVVKEFVAEMDGRLEVRSREGEGTCFKVILPRYSQPGS